jgi:hypothetical protein
MAATQIPDQWKILNFILIKISLDSPMIQQSKDLLAKFV